MTTGATLVDRLSAGVPCRMTLGHGDSCGAGHLCEACELRVAAALSIKSLTDALSRVQSVLAKADTVIAIDRARVPSVILKRIPWTEWRDEALERYEKRSEQ